MPKPYGLKSPEIPSTKANWSKNIPREQKKFSELLNSVLLLATAAILALLVAAVPLKVAVISVLQSSFTGYVNLP